MQLGRRAQHRELYILFASNYISFMFETPIDIEKALVTLGELLESRGVACEIIVIGGGAMRLLGLINRPTKDIDVVAVMQDGKLESAEPFPPDLARARDDVAVSLGIPNDWLNPGPTMLVDYGLPSGFEGRLSKRQYGGLTMNIAGRLDHVFFKFYATVDQWPRSRHEEDLHKLTPTREELLAAARWAREQDPSPEFRDGTLTVLQAFGVEEDDDAR